MKESRLLMGMPITIEIAETSATAEVFDEVYGWFATVEATFSPFKPTSEVSRFNRGELEPAHASEAMQEMMTRVEQTRRETGGYFDAWHAGVYNPSGLVKGWAIHQAALRLRAMGFAHFYVDAGGDVQLHGHNAQDRPWRVGIRNPFDVTKIIKILALTECGIATSGFYHRGAHIYNPHHQADPLAQLASLTVIGPNVYEADRFATAAFAMGPAGIGFIEGREGFEGYLIAQQGDATLTSHFARYVAQV